MTIDFTLLKRESSALVGRRPKSLFHYCPDTPESFDCLRAGRVWFSSPGKFADPFDCKLDLDVDDVEDSIVRTYLKRDPAFLGVGDQESSILTKEERNTQLGLQAKIHLQLEFLRLGVFCLSEVCDSLLMWSHYTTGHTGFCVEYSINWRRLQSQASSGLVLAPVTYSSALPLTSLRAFFETNSDVVASRMLLSLALTKAIEWSYEREWRILGDRCDETVEVPFRVKRIITGYNMSRQKRVELGEIAEAIGGVGLEAVLPSRREFRLEVVGVNRAGVISPSRTSLSGVGLAIHFLGKIGFTEELTNSDTETVTE